MSKKFTVLAILFCVCLIASNLFETKIFTAGIITLTGGFVLFPVSYILNDCISEVYGFRKAKFVIWAAFAMNAFFVLSAQLVRILPGASFWDGQEHFNYIFNANFRITVASMLAFITGSIMNAKVMARMKARDGEKRFGARAILSSLAGESIDSLVFFPIAFFGVGIMNLIQMMATQIILKTLYEVILLPVTARFVRFLKAHEKKI
ncbi:MAG: queuosine precursor transporter [Bacteroidales bacterium]|nr:queuosine precursor transporter [Candidatus Cryptobacteroides choladohippi]MCQ2178613.1 queuosine precursor transporter [Bacteroidales bacterium]